MADLLIATGHGADGLFHDDAGLDDALQALGIDVEVRDWKTIQPDGTPILIRTIWDYTQHADQFTTWLDGIERTGTRCFNAPATLRWNMDKRYLVEMEAKGHAIVPTVVLDDFSPEAAREEGELQEWPDLIAKPVVGGGAEGLTRIRDGHVQAFDVSGNTWAPDAAGLSGPCLLQPFMEAIHDGEWSLFYFGGAFSHAILKRPAGEDIRVQEEHGGTTTAATPPDEVLRASQAIVDDAPALYHRVDGVLADEFRLMELEMIEPELYFRYAPGAMERFAHAVADALTSDPQPGADS